MAKGVFLTAPELNNDEVAVSASSELGQRAGAPIPFASNSGGLTVTTLGDPGDSDEHSFETFGTEQRPMYAPLDTGGNPVYTAPETYATLGATIAGGSGALVALATCEDRLFAVVASGTNLTIFRWTGSAWTSAASTSIVEASGGIGACTVNDDIFVAVSNNTDAQIELYRFNRPTGTIAQVADSWISTDTLTVDSIAVATNGALFVLLAEIAGDVQVFFGGIGNMEQRATSISDRFSTAWSTGGTVTAPAITYNDRYQFVAAFHSGSGGSTLRLATTGDGDRWQQFKNLNSVVKEPTGSTAWGDAITPGIAAENNRVYVFRHASSDIKMQWFRQGEGGWSGEVDVDGGVAVDSGTAISAVNWRGEIYVAWRSAGGGTITIRKGNSFTATPGYYREIELGKPMFVAGIDDDSATALFFVATGTVTQGDKWTIPAAEYDFRVEHLLDDFLSKVWRGAQDDDQTILFDAGSTGAFGVDTVAVFGVNFPELTFELDDDVAFGSPAVTQVISSVVQTATISSVNRNRVVYAADTFEAHQYAGGQSRFWLNCSAGIFRILDNSTDALLIAGNATGATGSSTIFKDSMGYLFTSVEGPTRYARLTVPAITTPDGYCEIRRVVFGLRFEPPVDYRIGWTRRYAQQGARVELKDGARFNTLLNVMQRPAMSLVYRHYLENVRPVASFFGRTGGGMRLVGFWPDPVALEGDQPEVFPMYFSTDPAEMTDLGVGVVELAVTIEGQI